MPARTNKHVRPGSSKRKTISIICAVTTAFAVVTCAYILLRRAVDFSRIEQQRESLQGMRISETMPPVSTPVTDLEEQEAVRDSSQEIVEEEIEYRVMPLYSALYAVNPDMIGWLKIEDTLIDYPVVQTPEDENKYLYLDFYGEENSNGTLIMDTDSTVGVGTAEYDYKDGVKPSTNLIIHGHTMKSGEMFGNLNYYEDAEYGAEHNIICFDSLYESREYELIAVFYTQIYYPEDDVFKFYKFFQADTQEEFDDWYNNIKEMSLYDTGVTAELGDEFITLSCCSYQVEDGRFVVVGKRIS